MFLVSDRSERKILWYLTLFVGVGVCVFAFSGHDMPIRLIFLPLGVFLVIVAAVRLRRLGRRRPRSQRVE